MTEIGRMIRDEGIQEGIQEGIKQGIEKGKIEGKAEGKTEGKTELLIKQLVKKFKVLPKEYKDKINGLPEESIEVLATDIFEIEKLEDLKKYFE